MTREQLSMAYCESLDDRHCLCGLHDDKPREPKRELHIGGGVYPAVETAYGRTVDHGFNIQVF